MNAVDRLNKLAENVEHQNVRESVIELTGIVKGLVGETEKPEDPPEAPGGQSQE